MAYSTINKSTDFFNTKLYTGNGGTNAITGVGFQPDFVWIKDRDATDWHWWNDAARGATKTLHSNVNNAESTQATSITAFGTDGFTLGNDGSVNRNNDNYVSWNWKGGTTSGLSGGTITPSSYSINATSGFGVYKYTGNSTSGATIAHGLGKVPTMILVKRLDSNKEWQIYHTALGNGKWLEFTTGTPQTNVSRWNNTSPTSTLFYLGNDSDVNNSSGTYVAYVFCDVTGYSKMGIYAGNANADGTFVYTGFKPAFVLIKRTSTSGGFWVINDNKRNNRSNTANTNPSDEWLYASANDAEYDATNYPMDLLSNGFKVRHTGGYQNTANDYIYMAFGQSIVGSNNIPATAR